MGAIEEVVEIEEVVGIEEVGKEDLVERGDDKASKFSNRRLDRDKKIYIESF